MTIRVTSCLILGNLLKSSNGKNKDSLRLPAVWEGKFEVVGKMPQLYGME